MDAPEFDNVKAEKARAMRRYNRLRSARRFFRLFEIGVALLILFWTVARVPFAVRISGEFFVRVAGVISSPLFVFLVSNAIIAKSSSFSRGGKTGDGNVNSELYEKIVQNNENRRKSFEDYEGEDDKVSAFEIVYQDKEMICEVTATPPPRPEKNQEMEARLLDTEPEAYCLCLNACLCRESRDRSMTFERVKGQRPKEDE